MHAQQHVEQLPLVPPPMQEGLVDSGASIQQPGIKLAGEAGQVGPQLAEQGQLSPGRHSPRRRHRALLGGHHARQRSTKHKLQLPFLVLLSATMPRVGSGAAAGCTPWP
jgi:hypothetical protein